MRENQHGVRHGTQNNNNKEPISSARHRENKDETAPQSIPCLFPRIASTFPRREKKRLVSFFFFFAMKLGNDRRFCDTIKKEIKKKNSILIVKRGVMVVIGKGKRQFASRSRGGKKKTQSLHLQRRSNQQYGHTYTHIGTSTSLPTAKMIRQKRKKGQG